jgi:hypothetical protein
MEPEVAATGHGIPMHGTTLRNQLAELVARFDEVARPKSGRYVPQPATADASGVRSVPPPVVKPWLAALAVAGVTIGAVALVAASNGKKKRQPKDRKNKARKKSEADTFRAWYRDNPAELRTSGPDWQYRRPGAYNEKPQPSQPQGSGSSLADRQYSDQSSPKIETQYP